VNGWHIPFSGLKKKAPDRNSGMENGTKTRSDEPGPTGMACRDSDPNFLSSGKNAIRISRRDHLFGGFCAISILRPRGGGTGRAQQPGNVTLGGIRDVVKAGTKGTRRGEVEKLSQGSRRPHGESLNKREVEGEEVRSSHDRFEVEAWRAGWSGRNERVVARKEGKNTVFRERGRRKKGRGVVGGRKFTNRFDCMGK